jgi:hypothetical protein
MTFRLFACATQNFRELPADRLVKAHVSHDASPKMSRPGDACDRTVRIAIKRPQFFLQGAYGATCLTPAVSMNAGRTDFRRKKPVPASVPRGATRLPSSSDDESTRRIAKGVLMRNSPWHVVQAAAADITDPNCFRVAPRRLVACAFLAITEPFATELDVDHYRFKFVFARRSSNIRQESSLMPK